MYVVTLTLMEIGQLTKGTLTLLIDFADIVLGVKSIGFLSSSELTDQNTQVKLYILVSQ